MKVNKKRTYDTKLEENKNISIKEDKRRETSSHKDATIIQKQDSHCIVDSIDFIGIMILFSLET